MKATAKTAAVLAVAILGTVGAAWAVPVVDNVSMTQLPGTRMVKIDYTLTGTEDAIVTVSIETNGIALPDSALTKLSGDVCKVVQPGTGKSIIWDAGADWPENATTTAKAKVTAWSTNAPPLYCVVDVVGGANAQSYPVYYYVSADAVPGGVTNYIYKTVKILMRKIPPTGAEGFLMGSPDTETGRGGDETWHDVVLTKAFYIGVYEMTQSQWYQVMGVWPSNWVTTQVPARRVSEVIGFN